MSKKCLSHVYSIVVINDKLVSVTLSKRRDDSHAKNFAYFAASYADAKYAREVVDKTTVRFQVKTLKNVYVYLSIDTTRKACQRCASATLTHRSFCDAKDREVVNHDFSLIDDDAE